MLQVHNDSCASLAYLDGPHSGPVWLAFDRVRLCRQYSGIYGVPIWWTV